MELLCLPHLVTLRFLHFLFICDYTFSMYSFRYVTWAIFLDFYSPTYVYLNYINLVCSHSLPKWILCLLFNFAAYLYRKISTNIILSCSLRSLVITFLLFLSYIYSLLILLSISQRLYFVNFFHFMSFLIWSWSESLLAP